MILCTGKATRQIESIQAGEKEYIATIKLGATTPSFDLETLEDNQYPTDHISQPLLEEILNHFTGNILQVPPIFSAVKIDGKRAYEHARKGDEPELKPKNIVIKSIEVISFQLPEVVLRITCGKGTYIRALARDIGIAMQSGAYLTGLRRIRSGDYKVEEAGSIESFLEEIDSLIL